MLWTWDEAPIGPQDWVDGRDHYSVYFLAEVVPQSFDSAFGSPDMQRARTIIFRITAAGSLAMSGLAATSAHARRRGGSGHGEDPFPWLTDFVLYVLLGMLALAVVGALWRYFTRPSAADLARERSMRRLSRREERTRRRPPR